MKNVVLITGVKDKDGSYLTEYLLQKGHGVQGIICRSGTLNTGGKDNCYHVLPILIKNLDSWRLLIVVQEAIYRFWV